MQGILFNFINYYKETIYVMIWLEEFYVTILVITFNIVWTLQMLMIKLLIDPTIKKYNILILQENGNQISLMIWRIQIKFDIF